MSVKFNFDAVIEPTSQFTKFLKEKENILWTGQPKRGFQLRDTDIIFIPMSIILIGFAMILDYILMIYEAPFLFKVFGALLIILGIYFGIIRFSLDMLKRKRTFYCITDRRVLVISGRKHKLKTLPLKNIDHLDKTEEKDGSGFIIFGSVNPLWPWLLGNFYMVGDTVPGLEMLPDVNSVYDILEGQIKKPIAAEIIESIQEEKKEELN